MKIDGRTVTDEKEILAALQQEFDERCEFVILEDGADFMQTAGGELEYRCGEKQFRVSDAPVDQEKIRAAFLSYFRGDGSYLRDFEWEEFAIPGMWDELNAVVGKGLWSRIKAFFAG
ncbi:MAG: hypothetical protein IJC73_00855 [Lentisphaeria bacterium]|nr:hypothetical protein [Lentisphaeria bacterium]